MYQTAKALDCRRAKQAWARACHRDYEESVVEDGDDDVLFDFRPYVKQPGTRSELVDKVAPHIGSGGGGGPPPPPPPPPIAAASSAQEQVIDESVVEHVTTYRHVRRHII